MTQVSDVTQAQQLLVVRRDRYSTFGLLARAFAGDPNVRLVWDRRVRDRRRSDASSDGKDRRQADRRRNPSMMWGSSDYLRVSMNTLGSVTADSAPIDTFAQTASPERAVYSPDIHRDIESAVKSDLSVLISGGDIASREAVAQRIHQRSDRRERPFIVIDREALFDLSAVAETGARDAAVTEWMNAGTILIEEVAALSGDQQSQLFFILERRGVQGSEHRANGSREARIISGTGYELHDQVASKQFRADLFYRLNVIHLVLPSHPLPALD